MLSSQFKTFLLVAQTGSFTQAANRLFTTPASVMNQINALERRLDLKLLIRTNHGVKLTPAGKLLAEKGQSLFRRVDSLLTQAKSLANPDFIELRIGNSFLFPASFLLQLWEPFKEQYPQYKFSLVPYRDNQADLLEIINELGERVDILVGCFEANDIHGKAQYLILGGHKLCIAVPGHHKLAQKKKLTLQDLHGERLVMLSSGIASPIDKFQNMVLREHPKIIIENTNVYYNLETFNDCARHGHLLLSLPIWNHIHPSLITIPLDTNYEIPYGLLVAKKLTPAVQGFLNVINKR